MTRLASLHARITGDSSGFVTAAEQAEHAARGATAAMGTAQSQGGLTGAATGVRAAMNKVSGSYGMRMLPIQLSQVAQQAAAGTGVMRALSIQAADIGLAFGAVGAIVGTLATIAMPAMIAAFSDGGDEAEAFDQAMQDLTDATNGLKEAQDILSMSVTDLYEKYGLYSEQVLRVAENLLRLQEAQARARLDEQIDAMTTSLRDFMMTSNSAFQSGVTQAQAIARLADAFGMSSTEAREFEGVLRDVRDALTFEDRMAALERLNDLIEETGVDLATIPPELRQALIEMNNLTIATAELAATADGAADAIARMNSQGIGPGVRDANGNIALPPGSSNAEREEEASRNRRRGGGGGGGGGETFEDRLERLQEELEAETETIKQAHDERNEILREALERELLTREEYHALMEAERKRFHDSLSGMDVYRYGSGLQMAEQFMGDMASAFASGNEQMMRISKIFAAGEALINAWRTYSQVMADPTLPWFAKVPAAISLLGSAMQAVTAIQGAGKGGSGQRSASSAAGSAGSTVEPAGGGGSSRPAVSLTLIGEQGFTRAQIVQIAEALNDSGDEGQELVQVRGRR